MAVFKYFRKKKPEQIHHDLFSQEIKNQILHQRGNVENLFPSDFSTLEKENINLVKSFSMTSYERLLAVSRSIEYVEENNIEGDIVECGVWKGGSIMMAAIRLKQLGNMERQLFLFDTFEGMTQPTELDKSLHGNYAADLMNVETRNDPNNKWCFSPIEEVKNNVLSTHYIKENIHFIKGKVENTLPHDSIDKIALLRLDTDWYESTLHELETLYDKVVLGGIIIIDDYGHWSGSRKAVDEFISTRNLKIFLTRIDYSGRLIVKGKD